MAGLVAVRGGRRQALVACLVAPLILAIVGVPVIPLATSAPPPAGAVTDPVIAAAGDIACDPNSSNFRAGAGTSESCRQKYTSDLLVNSGLSAVLLLGDNQYYCGGLEAYQRSYDLSWGRVKAITRPSIGNHEYLTSGGTGCTSANAGAAGTFDYFGAAAGPRGKGYYSFNVGAWHIIALNSNCGDVGGCSSSSPQGQWLKADLAANKTKCTAAFWHIPRFSSGGRAASNSQPFWDALYAADADLILASHDHIYERFSPQTPQGAVDTARGIRQFIVGSGGANHTSLAAVAANSEVRNATTYGVLKLTLRPGSYDWNFVSEAGKSFTDAGTTACHGAGGSTTDPTPPTAPTNLVATAAASNQVNLSWSASTDNVGVTGYRIRRNGAELATTTSRSYADTSVSAATAYSYTVAAYDAAGNQSANSNTAAVTTPQAVNALLFRAVEDAYIQQDLPTSNFGSSANIVNDNSPVKRSLVKFDVSGVGTKRVLSAKLRLYNQDGSSNGGEAHKLADTPWGQGSVTWNTAPVFDPAVVSSLGSVSPGNWYEFDVTSLVPGDGLRSIGLLSTSSDGSSYSSREGVFPPELVVTTEGATLPTTGTFGASDDTYVQQDAATTNFGTSGQLTADNSPVRRSFLKFNVTGVGTKQVTSAKLRLYCTDGSGKGGDAYGLTTNGWTEATATWDNAPSLAPTLVSGLGSVAPGNWYEWDVTSLVAGDGLASVGLVSTSSDGAYYSSAEGAFPPQLVVNSS